MVTIVVMTIIIISLMMTVKGVIFPALGKYTADVDFVAVVILSGVGALLWVSTNSCE